MDFPGHPIRWLDPMRTTRIKVRNRNILISSGFVSFSTCLRFSTQRWFFFNPLLVYFFFFRLLIRFFSIISVNFGANDLLQPVTFIQEITFLLGKKQFCFSSENFLIFTELFALRLVTKSRLKKWLLLLALSLLKRASLLQGKFRTIHPKMNSNFSFPQFFFFRQRLLPAGTKNKFSFENPAFNVIL